MYGLKPDADLSYFVGTVLLQLCFGAHDLILHFTDDVSITVMSSIGLPSPGAVNYRYVDFTQAATPLLALLNLEVVGSKGSEDGTLTLEFSGGKFLYVYDDSQNYESYIMKYGSEEIVV